MRVGESSSELHRLMSSMASMRPDRGVARQQTPVEALNHKGPVTPVSKSKPAATKTNQNHSPEVSFGRAAYVNLHGQTATMERSLKAIASLQATYAQAQVARAHQGVEESEGMAFAPKAPGLQVTYASLAAGAYAKMAAITPPPSSPTQPVITNPVASEPAPPSPAEPSTRTEPAPTEPPPTDPAPTEPAPTEPAPTQPAPTQPALAEPAPTEPTPTEPAPSEPPPSEPAPPEPAPTEPTPTEPALTEPLTGLLKDKKKEDYK